MSEDELTVEFAAFAEESAEWADLCAGLREEWEP